MGSYNYRPAIKGVVCGAIWYTTECEMELIEAAFDKVYDTMRTSTANEGSGLEMARKILEELEQIPPSH
jgi:hypothetical protein